jgi:hypothetical protein
MRAASVAAAVLAASAAIAASPSSAGEAPDQRVGRGIGPSGVESRRIRLLRVVFALICAR